MSDERPWYLTPVQYTDGSERERSGLDESMHEGENVYLEVQNGPVGSREASKPSHGSTDEAPLDYGRGPHNSVFGVDDADEAS